MEIRGIDVRNSKSMAEADNQRESHSLHAEERRLAQRASGDPTVIYRCATEVEFLAEAAVAAGDHRKRSLG